MWSGHFDSDSFRGRRGRPEGPFAEFFWGGKRRRGAWGGRMFEQGDLKYVILQLLAEKLAVEDELERLRTKVLTVEATIMADWDSDRVEQAHLREKLNDIASEVSRLVYAVEGEAPDSDESLLTRVQKYSDEDLSATPELRKPEPVGQSAVSDRLAALREIHNRT